MAIFLEAIAECLGSSYSAEYETINEKKGLLARDTCTAEEVAQEVALAIMNAGEWWQTTKEKCWMTSWESMDEPKTDRVDAGEDRVSAGGGCKSEAGPKGGARQGIGRRREIEGVALGFGELGPIEGSFAALWQSRYAGYVPSGSLFSFFQRLGMTWQLASPKVDDA
ncbi:hypothetical protein CC78DRAFT_581489 [Lojkania enalia]|uniref:Uncharacterized protein n=1 Tax=Lojkania enalia TaxID=147567 RepID=A0A9P4MZ81_9PLEO|nr:hypothetical protein CC78DRAFT_581489 [Didymosphaeria enalia]